MWSCETFFSPETYLTRVVLRYRLNYILKTILWPITTVLVENPIYSPHFLHSVLIIPRFPPVKLMSLKFIQTRKSKHLFCATSSWKKKSHYQNQWTSRKQEFATHWSHSPPSEHNDDQVTSKPRLVFLSLSSLSAIPKFCITLSSTVAHNCHGKTKKSRQNKENELASGWSAVVICIWNGTLCNSNTRLARKTAIFRACNVLHRVWFISRWRCKLL